VLMAAPPSVSLNVGTANCDNPASSECDSPPSPSLLASFGRCAVLVPVFGAWYASQGPAVGKWEKVPGIPSQ
jgi:hypothetical protein